MQLEQRRRVEKITVEFLQTAYREFWVKRVRKNAQTRMNATHLLQRQVQKNTSRNKYPRESKIAPAAIAMSASPRFWIDCMLTDIEEKAHQWLNVHNHLAIEFGHRVEGTHKP